MDQLVQIALLTFGFDIHLHGPEFEDHETLSPIANSFLAKKNGALRNEFNPHSEKKHDRQPEGHAEQNTGDIEHAFPDWNLRSCCGRNSGSEKNLRISLGRL